MDHVELKRMETAKAGSTGLARMITKISNPCILSVIMLLAIAWTYPDVFRNQTVWTIAILSFFVVIPLVYIFLRRMKSKDNNNVKIAPTTFLRQHPRDIIVLGLICGVPSLLVLEYLEAPPVLLKTLIALLLGSVIVAFIYIFYKVSFHLTALTILIVMAVAAWGAWAGIFAAGIPLVSWAKHRTHEHTVFQLICGIALAVAISLAVWYWVG